MSCSRLLVARGGRWRRERAERLIDEWFLRERAEDFDRVVDDRLRNAADLILACEIRKLRGFDSSRRDVRIRKRHFVCEADRPRTMRSSRSREHLKVQGSIDAGELLPADLRKRRRAPASQEDGLHERHEFVPGRSAEKTHPRIVRPRSVAVAAAENRDRRRAIDPVLLRLVLLENEVDFLDRALV